MHIRLIVTVALIPMSAVLTANETASFNAGISTFVSIFEKDIPHCDKHQGGIRYTRLRSPGTRKGLFRWELGMTPFGDQPIAQARAYFYCIASRNPGRDVITAHAMQRSWSLDATWMKPGQEPAWGAPGLQPDIDYTGNHAGSTQAASQQGVWLEITLDPALVNSWFRNPASNVGIMLQAPKNTGLGIDCQLANFATRQEYLRPRLVVAADPETALLPPAAKAPTDACEYRLYDPGLDPPTLPLDQVQVRYAGYQDTQWGDIEIPARSSWPVWARDGSLRVVITQEPLTIDKPFYREGEGFDSWRDTNDNYGGQWRSPDGKTLFFAQSRTVRRFAPFRVEYDNLRQVNRIMVLWSTQDGIHWTPDWFDVPEDTASTAFQNYGLRIASTPDPDTMIGYNCAYDQWAQQIYMTFHFSHDGRYWDHIPGQLTFAAPGGPGDWNFGSMFFSGRTVHVDGRALQAIGYATGACHFYHEIKHAKARDAAAVERRFGTRELKQNWPYFSAIGGWSGLADHIQQATYAAGIAEWRQDGWVALHADGTEMFTTRPLANADTLAINAATGQLGSLKIEVLTADGKDIPDYCGANAAQFSGDSVRHPIVWKTGTITTLPKGTFKLRVTLLNADLYALYW